jgi:hypothetical protein
MPVCGLVIKRMMPVYWFAATSEHHVSHLFCNVISTLRTYPILTVRVKYPLDYLALHMFCLVYSPAEEIATNAAV